MTKTETAVPRWLELTPQALLQLGVEDVAYVKPLVAGDGARLYAVHSADGQHMANFADLQTAFAACRQHDLEPVRVH